MQIILKILLILAVAIPAVMAFGLIVNLLLAIKRDQRLGISPNKPRKKWINNFFDWARKQLDAGYSVSIIEAVGEANPFGHQSKLARKCGELLKDYDDVTVALFGGKRLIRDPYSKLKHPWFDLIKYDKQAFIYLTRARIPAHSMLARATKNDDVKYHGIKEIHFHYEGVTPPVVSLSSKELDKYAPAMFDVFLKTVADNSRQITQDFLDSKEFDENLMEYEDASKTADRKTKEEGLKGLNAKAVRDEKEMLAFYGLCPAYDGDEIGLNTTSS